MATFTNLAINPSIEVDTFDWTPGASTVARSSAWSYSGSHSLEVTATGSLARPGIRPVVPATPHVVSLWVYHTLGTSRNFLIFYNEVTSPTKSVPSGVPTQITTSITGTGAIASLQIRMPDSIVGEVFHVDAVLIHAGSALVGYFDGDSPNAIWTGTPHASTSVITLPDVRPITTPIIRIGSPHVGPLRVGKA